MSGLALLVVLGMTIVVGAYLAERLRIAAPILWLVLGGAIGFVPALGKVELSPDLVLLLFLPALLHWESLNTSLREIRANLRTIALLATGLVFATAIVVAVIGHSFGMPWAVAVAFGAILAPSDGSSTTPGSTTSSAWSRRSSPTFRPRPSASRASWPSSPAP